MEHNKLCWFLLNATQEAHFSVYLCEVKSVNFVDYEPMFKTSEIIFLID